MLCGILHCKLCISGVFMTGSTSYCLCDMLMDPWNVCTYVCMCVCMYVCMHGHNSFLQMVPFSLTN